MVPNVRIERTTYRLRSSIVLQHVLSFALFARSTFAVSFSRCPAAMLNTHLLGCSDLVAGAAAQHTFFDFSLELYKRNIHPSLRIEQFVFSDSVIEFEIVRASTVNTLATELLDGVLSACVVAPQVVLAVVFVAAHLVLLQGIEPGSATYKDAASPQCLRSLTDNCSSCSTS